VKTHLYQLHQDVAAIDAALPADNFANHAERAGRLDALATYYANCADNEAAHRQRLGRDPKAFMAAFTSQPGGPSAADLAVLLTELHIYLRLRPELFDADEHIEEAARQMQVLAEAEQYNRDTDLDAPAAARSDDEYTRRQHDGLIGRSLLNQEEMECTR
jgi:hypothetical protein